MGQPAPGLAVHLLSAIVIGVTYALLFRPALGGYSKALMSGTAYGLLWWILLPLSLLPALAGRGPAWPVEAAASAFPALLGYLFQGAAVGIGCHALSETAAHGLGAADEQTEKPERPAIQHRIVILGGGFAGVTTAQRLERLFAGDDTVAITLVSNANHLVFTPMLSEVTAGGVEGQHVCASLRAFFRRVQVIRGEAKTVDLAARVVQLRSDGVSSLSAVPFDQLVLAVGSVPNFFDLESAKAAAHTFKSLEDASALRNHVIEMLERADFEQDAARRKALLTFVVAGGGFAGTELIGGLNDFVRGSLWYYPNLLPEDISLILVHSGQRILPELSPELAEYARERLDARGVTLKLGARVSEIVPGRVTLNNGQMVATETLVWTAGSRPHPMISELGLETDGRGAAKTDATLAVLGRSNMWAVGDCAAIPDARTGKLAPPTAQHALREAAVLAQNIHAAIRGGKPKPFSHRSMGSFAILGHRTACAEIRGLRFSGSLAWLMWRGIYLFKLPNPEKRIRVALDWVVDIFFPRDIVQTSTFHRWAQPAPGPQQVPWAAKEGN